MPGVDPTDSPPSAALEARWTERGTSAYRRFGLALFLAGFATFSLLYCVQPLLPEFAREFGVSPAESSLALSLSTLLLAFALMLGAAFGEGVSRRWLIFASVALAALLNITAGLAPDWRLLLTARALEGLALGGVPAIAMAYIAEEIHPKNLGFAMGVYIGGNAFGGMIGRVGMGALAEWASWRTALCALGAFDLLAIVGFILLAPRSRNFVRRRGLGLAYHLATWAGHLRHGRLPRLFAISFLAMGAFITVYNYAGFRLVEPPYNLPQTRIGLIFTAYLFGIVSSSSAGAMADRFGRGPVVIAGLVIAGAGVALTLAQPLAAVIGGIVVLTFGFFMAHAAGSGWVGRMATNAKGHAASLYLLAYYLGASLIGSGGGWFWSRGGWPWVAAFTGLLLALALLNAVSLPQRRDA